MQNSEAGKSRPVPKPRTRLSQSIQKSQIEDEQKLGSASCTKQLVGNCETRDANTLHDSKSVLVTGLSEKSTTDALWNYMELMTGEDVVKVTFLGQGRAVVDTSGPPDFEKLVNKVNSRNLDEMQLSVERIKACDSILVSGLSAQVTKDTITLYFENVRRSGGGDVKDVVLHKDTNSAVVYFEDGQAVDNVIGKEHTLEGQQLSVEKYYPQLSSENAPTSEAMASSYSKKQEKRDVSPEYYPQNSSNLQSMSVISLTDITPSFNETRQSTRPVIQDQEIPDITVDREMASIDVDADIMQFIMDGAYAVDLQRIVEEQLKAEIEWEPGNETVTIVKKVKSGYIKKWKERCRDAVSTFLDQFENISIQLSSVAGASVINDALPRLEERLPKKKALCKGDEVKENVIIVCHESDRDNVKTIVENFLEIVEKEEVRKTYKEDEIEVISKKRMEFLRHIRFIEEMKLKSAELEVDVDYEKQKMRLVGLPDQIKSFKMEYFRLMEEITEQSFQLPPSAFSIFTNRTDYFQQRLALNNITAMFFPEEGNVIRIVAKSFPDCQEAKTCLLDSIKQKKVPLKNENAFIFKSEKSMGFVKELEKRQLVNISIDKSGSFVVLYGVIENVVSAEREVEDFVEMERIRSNNFKIPEGHASFLQRFRAKDLKDIEEVMKIYHVSMHIHQDSVEMKGTHEGLLKSEKPFCELRDTIVAQKKTFSKPGLGELIRGENGQRNLKMIAEERESVIELYKDGNHGVPNNEIQDSISSSDEKAPVEVVAPSQVVSPYRFRHPDYDICQFTTKEGLNVSWNYGNLELVTADVLVNSANSNLKNPTACGHALIRVGGEQFIEACQKFTSINSGEIECTSGGNLSCKHVIHAVCGDWDGEGGDGEKKLRGLVQKILSKCVELRASSLAIPIIGTGGHKFPEKIVIRVYREEIEKFSKGHPSQLCLKSVGIVVFKKPSETSASLPLSKSSRWFSSADGTRTAHVPRQSAGTIYDNFCNFTTKEGTKVSWKYGNIEKESADVLVSSATSDLNSPTVCGKALNAVGGSSFVQACQPFNNIGEGNIACTAGGNLSCKHVLHAVCCDWKKRGSKKVLQGLVRKMLSKCAVLGASSLALSIIGTGQHKFPEKEVLRIYKQEIETFSAATSSQCSLKDISIVVFSAKRPATPLPSQPIPNQPSPSIPPTGLSRAVSFGQVRVSLHEGDITQQPTQSDALINILSPDLQLKSGGGVCASILKSGGVQIQNDLNQAAGALPGSVVKTSAGSIGGVRKIIHAIPTTNDVPGLQSSMAQCLNAAKSESLSSVSIPAVGTASFHVSAKDSAELILKAAKDFSSVNYPLAVNIVVFQKNMLPDFEAKIHENVIRNAAAGFPNTAQSPVQPSATSPNLPSQTTGLTPAPASIANTTASMIPKPQPVDYKSLKFEVAIEVIQLTFTAGSQRAVEESIREVQKFIDDQIAVKTIEHENVCDVLSKNWQEIEKLARKHKVNITCESPSKVAFEGLLSKASECKEKLQGFVLKDVVEEQRMSEHKNEQNLVEYFSKTVQWSQLQGTQWVGYGKDVNAAIEKAFINEDRQIAITGQMFDVDFTAMTLKSQNNGQVTTITRKRIGENSTNNSDIPLPTNWSPQPRGKLVQLVSLPTSSPEYQNVQRRFSSTGGGSKVISIERIQNPTLYKAYAAMKQIMPRPNEMQLFHGTNANNTAAINQNGFNRIFAGINGVALGNGIYFAKDASLSLGYSKRGTNVVSGYYKMYLAKVLAGDYTQGSGGIKTPPKKNDPNNPELLYDSTVNNVQNPAVVVTFLDPQCYPEYLITFK